MDANYDLYDISQECLQAAIDDCRRFQEQNADLLDNADYQEARWSDDEMAGHDFFLTRNGHGVGFWDRDLGEVGDRLSDAAEAFGEVWFYVGDDGQIYC